MTLSAQEAEEDEEPEGERGEARLGPIRLSVLIKVGVVMAVVMVALFIIGYVVVRCWTYTVDHETVVTDKSHTVWYSDRCISHDDEGNCLAYTKDRHESYTIILADGHSDSVGEGKYQVIQIGQNYTYTTSHVACR